MFGGEDPDGNVRTTPLQPHHRDRTLPGKSHRFTDGSVPRAVVAVPRGDQEPMNAVEHSDHNLAFMKTGRSPFA